MSFLSAGLSDGRLLQPAVDALELGSDRELQRSLSRFVVKPAAAEELAFLRDGGLSVQLPVLQVQEKQARSGHRGRWDAQDVPLSVRGLQPGLRGDQQLPGRRLLFTLLTAASAFRRKVQIFVSPR